MGATELVGVILLLAVLVVVAGLVGRRLQLLRGGGVDVSLRRRVNGADGVGWHVGVGRYHGNELAWFRLASLWPGPTVVVDRTVLEMMRSSAPGSTDGELRRVLGAFLFSGETVDQLVGTLSGGEKTRLALAALVTSGANVLLLDEPTNNLDPASRQQVLAALNTYAGAVVLVTHDEGAVAALKPEKVILLPDGDEDAWSDDLVDLVALA